MPAALELPIDVGKYVGALLVVTDALASNECGHGNAKSRQRISIRLNIQRQNVRRFQQASYSANSRQLVGSQRSSCTMTQCVDSNRVRIQCVENAIIAVKHLAQFHA